MNRAHNKIFYTIYKKILEEKINNDEVLSQTTSKIKKLSSKGINNDWLYEIPNACKSLGKKLLLFGNNQ